MKYLQRSQLCVADIRKFCSFSKNLQRKRIFRCRFRKISNEIFCCIADNVGQQKSATQDYISLQKTKICNEKPKNVADMHASAILQRNNWCVAEYAMQIFLFFVVHLEYEGFPDIHPMWHYLSMWLLIVRCDG